ITMEEAEGALRHYQEQLERAFTETREATRQPTAPGAVIRQEPAAPAPIDHGATPTAITEAAIKQIIDSQLSVPEGVTAHQRPRPRQVLQGRGTMVAEDAIDWATGELLAFGSVLMDHHTVRLVGQDTRRGTFGQRHAVLVDRNSGAEYTPLKQFNSARARFHV